MIYNFSCKRCGVSLSQRIVPKGYYCAIQHYCPVCGWIKPPDKIGYATRTMKEGDTE